MTLQNDEQKVVAADGTAIAWVKANAGKVVVIVAVLVGVVVLKFVL